MTEPVKFLKRQLLERLLEGVEKPGRYIGNETGIKSKSIKYLVENPGTVTAALVFPDIYEVGMSNLGLQILYSIINKKPFFSAERAFCPWTDFEKNLRKEKIKLFSLENRIYLDCFDLIGFNAAHEMLYTNILNVLDLSGLKIRSEKRNNPFPLVCAGGSSTVNPWPLSKFVDFMLIGDGEEAVIEIMKILRSFKESSSIKETFLKLKKHKSLNSSIKHDILKKLSALDGVFVPQFYKTSYNIDGTISSISANFPQGPVKETDISACAGYRNSSMPTVKKAVVKNLDEFGTVTDPVVANIPVVHDRLNVEIMRGCARSCRFCQAGFIYRPVRCRNFKDLVLKTIEGINNTGYDEVSFTSLSSSDYPGLNSLILALNDLEELKHTSISMPSLRLDTFRVEVAGLLNRGKKTGLTFAPEAGSQKMRDIIKKDIKEEDLIESAKIAILKGWDRIKLYFMVGLPFEKTEDIHEIPALIDKVIIIARQHLSGKSFGRFGLSVSINAFCPKPFTPFQWAGQDTVEMLETKIGLICANIKKKFIKLHYNSPKKSRIECALSRGNSRISEVIESAWKKGSKFDNWTDFFNYDLWLECFEELGIDINFYTARKIPEDEILPWDIVDIGLKKEFFLKQYHLAQELAGKNADRKV